MTQTEQVKVTDGMHVEWDVPIVMDDGVQLRADIFRPTGARTLPGAAVARPLRERSQLSNRLCRHLGPAGFGLSGGDPQHHQQLPKLRGRRPRAVGAARVRLRPRRLMWRRALARICQPMLGAGNPGLSRLHRMGRHAALEQRQGRPGRNLLLRAEPVASRGDPACAPGRDVHLGGQLGLVPRGGPPRRHPVHVR
ncbi:MAG: hypothetical protein QOE41_4022 [Mycobacterium sp.]|jgi:hypothetical protein|nr:Peptidase [Mycobacterium sp.]MDT5134711.1 hypothetical protein [Mycobacterium sp.]